MAPFKFVTRPALIRVSILLMVLIVLTVWAWSSMVRMPLRSYRGPLPPLTREEAVLEESLRRDVQVLAEKIGERNVVRAAALQTAANYIEEALSKTGQPVLRQTFQAQNVLCHNLEWELKGTRCPRRSWWWAPITIRSMAVLGQRQWQWRGCVAGLGARVRRVAFCPDTPPGGICERRTAFFSDRADGSRVYAQRCRERQERVVAMISLETIGYYSDAPGSQHYPFPLGLCYPGQGNFVAFVGNVSSGRWSANASVRSGSRLSSRRGGGSACHPAGIGWSDHWAFWQEGYPAVMVTDTAPFRYLLYHTQADLPERVDYGRTARVVAGIEKVVRRTGQPVAWKFPGVAPPQPNVLGFRGGRTQLGPGTSPGAAPGDFQCATASLERGRQARCRFLFARNFARNTRGCDSGCTVRVANGPVTSSKTRQIISR